MTLNAYLLPLSLEWAILITSLVPLLAPGRGSKRPRLAIGLLLGGLVSVVIAISLALIVAVQSVYALWQQLSSEPASKHTVASIGPALLAATAPWALLALAGVTVAVVNLRLEPVIAAAREVAPRLAEAVKLFDEFHGVPVGRVTAPIPLSFVTRVDGRSAIVLSTHTLTELDAAQLEAVLWHELGHIRGRHNALKSVAAALRQVAPRIAASRILVSRLDELCELAADNFAAKHVSRQTLLAARAKFD